MSSLFSGQRYCKRAEEINIISYAVKENGEKKNKFEDSNLIIIDANNLYGWAQSKYLPIGDFRWLNDSEIANLDLEQQTEEQETGYIYEVDLIYPPNLHASHNSFPLAPEKMEINNDLLSPYASDMHHAVYGGGTYKSTKLVSTFLPRKKYVVHYRNLQLYLELGLKLEKVHRVMSFTQSNFLKQYVDYCTEKRAAAKTEFGKRLYKLLINSCFGKFVENCRKYTQSIICTSKHQAKKWISSTRFESLTIIKENLIVISLSLVSVWQKKPFAIGFSILELSKYFMFDEFYNKIRKKLPNCDLFFTDTDSLGLISYQKNPISRISSLMDFSNYPPNHPYYSVSKKLKLGYWKDEMKGNPITEFVGIRSKTYAVETTLNKYSLKMYKDRKQIMRKKDRCENCKEADQFCNHASKITCKGVKRAYKDKIPFKKFKNCIDTVNAERVTFHAIRSYKHEIHTIKASKLAFSSFDDKRHLLCSMHSLPYGSMYIKAALKSKECPLC